MIASIWKSSPLQKKLCHFMVMVLSCFDLATLLTNCPAAIFPLISWLKEDYDPLFKVRKYLEFVSMFIGFSYDVLLVLRIERYLGAYYPISHRTSVTKRRLSTLLAILLILHTTFYTFFLNVMIMSRALTILIFTIALLLPLV